MPAAQAEQLTLPREAAYVFGKHTEQLVAPAKDAAVPLLHGTQEPLTAKEPGAQATHSELLAGAAVPAAHTVQLLAVPPGDAVPAAHTEHVRSPETTLPPGHVNGAHAEAPELAAVMPFGHARQAVSPVALANVFGAQRTHCAAP